MSDLVETLRLLIDWKKAPNSYIADLDGTRIADEIFDIVDMIKRNNTSKDYYSGTSVAE